MPRELTVTALTRARMCELLGAAGEVAADELFTVGLLSAADALLALPMAAIVEELPLAEGLAAALLSRAGPAGEILDAVISYERGEFAVPSLQPHRHEAADAYREALRWANETAGAVAA
jgi:EAL and modified HD-GYP domain-containing signal transduction protein